ncbi:chromate transporter [Ralstonia solanacearum]|uniref:chromate transporter n=1 Tax=Ralstonia solanacearum TaxID=305 RepID=UPI003D807956
MESGMSSSRPARAIGAIEVLAAFLKLGLTSFGGPVAHIGYFRREFVERRRWLDDATFTDLVGLCQFLPGPASSQVGFSIGLLRAGWLGGLAAWCGFTLPSVLLLIAFAAAAPVLSGPVGGGLIHGLKLVAVAVVAQAVWDMANRLCPDRRRAAIALAVIGLLGMVTSVYAQIAAIALGAGLGFALCRHLPRPGGPGSHDTAGHGAAFRVSRSAGALALMLFSMLLFGLPVLSQMGAGDAVRVFEAFYRSGALVPLHRGYDSLAGLQDRQAVVVNEQFDAASEACLPADQSIAFEVEHHLMDGRSRDGEEALHVAFGRSTGVYQAVGPDEGEILTLLVGEARAG